MTKTNQISKSDNFEKKEIIIPTFIILAIIAVSILGNDFVPFIKWELITLLMSFVFLPLTSIIFKNFSDCGFAFSRPISILISGYVTWLLVNMNVPFNTASSLIITIGLCIVSLYLWKKGPAKDIKPDINLILVEELIFVIVLIFWSYVMGFRPQAFGTEKFMDYAYMASMMRSPTIPSTDPWYSEGVINYYYGGQFYAVFLTKITFTDINVTYNLMRAFIATSVFTSSFSLAFHVLKDKFNKESIFCTLGGITAGTSVTMCGNMHYVIYGVIKPLIFKTSYWFPDSTRYIGYNPDREDKTIHEFPSYSYILGDLHAHVVNALFVVIFVAVLYSYIKNIKKKTPDSLLHKIFTPHTLLCTLMLGIYQWTNYWDYIIYFTVFLIVIIFTNIIVYDKKDFLKISLSQLVSAYILSQIVILPFTMKFVTMAQGVNIAKNHSYFYQLIVLWGLPVTLVILLAIKTILETLSKKPNNLLSFLKNVNTSDYFALMIGISAIGLLIMPELIYVKDIYGDGYSRSNTMFKLTYQAYIMFGIVTSYGIFSILVEKCNKIYRTIAIVGLFLTIFTLGYLKTSITAWCGNIFIASNRPGMDATAFLESDPETSDDAAAIRWLLENVEGPHVCLEANGDSYTSYERVSAMTGLSTVLGWYVHEWLWRNNTDDLNAKALDIENIYTSTDINMVNELINKYGIEYIFIGSKETEKYPDRVNHTLIQSLGDVVFYDNNSRTYIIKIKK